jgi:hypothetical protein
MSHYDDFSYCFNCGRATDHSGEHDGLVAAGLVTYDAQTGSVNKTEKWTRELAALVSEAEYQFVYASEREDLIEVRVALDEAIEAVHAARDPRADFNSGDWSACDALFKKGMSLALGADVTTIAKSAASKQLATV